MLQTFQAIVRDYRRHHQDQALRELRFFRIQKSLERAVGLAGSATGPSGKRFSHQRRIPRASLEEARARLLSALSRLRNTATFDYLHRVVKEIIDPIEKIGELMVYDTALRIGAKLHLMPGRVYIHAGTRRGARALGFQEPTDSIAMSDLPAAFQGLEPHEVEDCLCIYKADLEMLARRRPLGRGLRGASSACFG